jgi:hypothetical protein
MCGKIMMERNVASKELRELKSTRSTSSKYGR